MELRYYCSYKDAAFMRLDNEWRYSGEELTCTTKDPDIQPENHLIVHTGVDQFYQENIPATVGVKKYDIPETISFPAKLPIDLTTYRVDIDGDCNINMQKTSLSARQSARVDVTLTFDSSETQALPGSFNVDPINLLPVYTILEQSRREQTTNFGRTVTITFLGLLADTIRGYTTIGIHYDFKYQSSPQSYEFFTFKLNVSIRGWLVDQIFYSRPTPARVCKCCSEEMDREKFEQELLDSLLSCHCSGGLASLPGPEPSLLPRCDSGGSCSSFDII